MGRRPALFVALALSMPGGVAIAGLFGLGFLDRTVAFAAAAAMLGLAALLAVASAVGLAGTRAAICAKMQGD